MRSELHYFNPLLIIIRLGLGVIVKPHKSHTKLFFFHLYEKFFRICDWSVIAVPKLPLVNKIHRNRGDKVDTRSKRCRYYLHNSQNGNFALNNINFDDFSRGISELPQ